VKKTYSYGSFGISFPLPSNFSKSDLKKLQLDLTNPNFEGSGWKSEGLKGIENYSCKAAERIMQEPVKMLFICYKGSVTEIFKLRDYMHEKKLINGEYHVFEPTKSSDYYDGFPSRLTGAPFCINWRF
jgi:hypothetical protein